MKAQKLRLIVLTLLALVLLPAQNVRAFAIPLNLFQQTPPIASVSDPPLGYQSGVIFAPRQTYDNNNILIEDTNYGVKNPDLNRPSTCFGFDWRDLYHAGEDLYNDDNPSATVEGEIVSAVANGTVTDISDPQQIWYDGYAVTIKHILPSGQEVYSVYIHLNTVDVSIGDPVSPGQQLGTVIYQPYRGLFQNYHSTDDSHLHFEIRYFPDARGIYAGYPACELSDVAGRGYTPPDIHPDNYPASGAGYTDPSDFIASHGVPTSTATSTPPPSALTPTAIPTAQGTLPSQINGGPGITTISNLIPGMQYRIVISGVVNYNFNISGDAQWNDYQMAHGCFCRYSPAVNFNGVQLAAQNGQTAYDPNHTYTFLWVADNTQLQMYIGDSYYGDNSGSFNYQIFEDSFVGTPTPIPTSTGPTSTPLPTSTPESCPCPLDDIANGCVFAASSDEPKTIFHTVKYIQQALFDIQLFHRVEDEILSQTPLGQHYIDLYYGHGIEITDILRNNSALKDEAVATLQLWEPNLQALVDGQGNTIFISQEEVDAVESFLLNLEAVASNDLKAVLQDEKANLNIQGLVGQTMSQAWEEINGMATPTPTNTPTNTPTSTPTFTPTFTPTNTPTLTPTYTPINTPSSTPTMTPTPTNTPTFTPTNTPTNTHTATPAQPNQPLYLSLNNVGTVGGVTAQDIDILSFNGTTWSMFFDGSDVGINTSGQDLNEFYVLDADTLLLIFDEPITLGTLAVDPWDVVRFDATSLGNNTAGTFSMYLDGNDVGLDATSEYLDSLHVLPDGRVLISTTGSPSVSGVTGAADEDILAFTPTTLGDVTSGTWSMYFDGSDVGLADSSAEDIDALAVRSNGDIYLSTEGNFSVTGVSGFDEDVFICTPTSLGAVTACTYSPSLYFDGSVYGLDANDVDGINLILP